MPLMPLMPLMPPMMGTRSWFAGILTDKSNKQCVVYKAATCCESEDDFKAWLDVCVDRDGHNAINVVGAPSSKVSCTSNQSMA